MNVYIKTYGCQMNERDSESAAAMLETLNLLYGREELLTLWQDGGPEASK